MLEQYRCWRSLSRCHVGIRCAAERCKSRKAWTSCAACFPTTSCRSRRGTTSCRSGSRLSALKCPKMNWKSCSFFSSKQSVTCSCCLSLLTVMLTSVFGFPSTELMRWNYLHFVLFLYSKIFDSDLSPLPFNAEQMFHFLAVRFENTGAEVQEQNLSWMQVGIAGVV